MQKKFLWMRIQQPCTQHSIALVLAALLLLLFCQFWLAGNAAHAFAQPICAQTRGGIVTSCEGLDRVPQGCVADAQTIKTERASNAGTLIGEVDLRFSPVCGTIAYPQAVFLSAVVNVNAQVSSLSIGPTQKGSSSGPVEPDGSLSAWTPMKPSVASGSYDLTSGQQVVVALK